MLTTLTLELPPEVYQRLQEEASRVGKAPEMLAQEWLGERLALLTPEPVDNRHKVRQALRAAGLLVALSPGLRLRADCAVPLEQVEASLARAGGKPLSEIILDQRGPKG